MMTINTPGVHSLENTLAVFLVGRPVTIFEVLAGSLFTSFRTCYCPQQGTHEQWILVPKRTITCASFCFYSCNRHTNRPGYRHCENQEPKCQNHAIAKLTWTTISVARLTTCILISQTS